MDNPRKYKIKDYEQICSWIKKRGFDCPDKNEFSNTGMIVDGIAAAFIYLTNSNVAILGNTVTNPDAPKEDRQEALRKIANDLEAFAKSCGYKKVKFDTIVGSIEALMTELGYLSLGNHKSFAKELN